MLCKQPFCRTPVGVTKKQVILSDQARLAATPFGCGQCLHCRINQARTWSHRILLEQLVTPVTAFITLTYNDENLPYELSKEHLRNFFKRLRKRLQPTKIRYFAVGEYGDLSYRPHYHIALFAQDTFGPDEIDAAWPFGFTQTGELNKDSARYIVGYVTQKLTKRNDMALMVREPEFMTCSKMSGGIGIKAIEKIAKELKENKYFKPQILQELTHGKQKMPLGRYLTRKLADILEIPEHEFKSKVWDHQHEIFDRYLEKPSGHINALLVDTRADRESQEGKQRIFKQRRGV